MDIWVATTPLGHRVRLSEAAWTKKILVSHTEFAAHPGYIDELRKTLEEPESVVEGWAGELLIW